VNRNILNSKGVHVGIVARNEILGLRGQKIYKLKGSNIYKLNGDLVVTCRMRTARRCVWTRRPTSCFRQPEFHIYSGAFFQTRIFRAVSTGRTLLGLESGTGQTISGNRG
jgi:hypothetical protein